MAGGCSRDGAVQDQIDVSVEDEIARFSINFPELFCRGASGRLTRGFQHSYPQVL